MKIVVLHPQRERAAEEDVLNCGKVEVKEADTKICKESFDEDEKYKFHK